ncbi:unnamed protein product [Amoebophrya sp. A25]|nr:unnamed protein product [Amoebophrya sp. A25]|eukprot:GSA25T00012708001.1
MFVDRLTLSTTTFCKLDLLQRPCHSKMLDAIGRGSKPPVCAKKSHPLASFAQKSHFQIGVEDDQTARQRGATHRNFPDPEVVYCRYIPPNKNRSIVNLTQGEQEAWRSEQNARFVNNGPQKRRDPCPGAESQLHLGDDPPEQETQYAFTHKPGQEKKAMPPNTCKWPRWPGNNVLTGEVNKEPDIRFRPNQQKQSQDKSYIEHDNTRIRNPTTGEYNDRKVHNGLTSYQMVMQENKTAPPLLSVGAVRHRTTMDRYEFKGSGSKAGFDVR